MNLHYYNLISQPLKRFQVLRWAAGHFTENESEGMNRLYVRKSAKWCFAIQIYLHGCFMLLQMRAMKKRGITLIYFILV